MLMRRREDRISIQQGEARIQRVPSVVLIVNYTRKISPFHSIYNIRAFPGIDQLDIKNVRTTDTFRFKEHAPSMDLQYPLWSL